MKTSPNYKNIQQRLFLIVSIFLNTLLFAQTYPVQVNPQLIPPYSLKISDYATTTSEKLYLNILLTDVNEVGRRVRLKMYIEGQGLAISTQEVIMGETPIFLNGGINTRLSNVDLQAYFQLNNLIGITPQQFNSPLPNGGYDFCFEVYDYFTNRKLSGKSCTTAYLLQNDPPILNLPFKNNIVTATNPQNILFTWTPRHTNANNVQYEYTLKELWDVQNPQASFLASIPFYQTTTYNTTLLVGPETPQLMSGKIYGWQVRAFVSDGINETSVFKNDGKSEIFWFKYLKDCSAPSFVISQALTAESVQINWQASAHIRYRIQYRKKGFGDDDWFDVNTYTNEGKIFNLEADTVYEFRVGGECTQLSGFAYSNIQEFTTPTNDEAAYYNCGLTPEINITNNDPLPKLGVNETFTAGDFPVITRKVTGSNGTFSGWGYITLPFLENIKEIIDAVNILTDDGTEEKKGNINIGKYTRIKVTFSGISINTSYELTKGLVKTDYDPEWGGILDLDAVIDDVFGDDGETNSFDASNIDIKTVTVNADGAIVITAENGETQTITSDKPVTITDKNGDQWTVHEDGTVTKGKVAEGGVPTKNNTEGISSAGNVTEISSKDVRVKFIPSGYYSNDTHNESITSSKYKKQYEFVKTHDDKEYSVLYKLASDVSSNKTDVVKAEVSFANGKTKKDIVFKTKQGIKIDSSWSDNVVTLKFKKEFKFAKDEIIATVKPKDSTKKYTVAGKLNIWHAKERSINLTLVSVNKGNTDGVKKRINEIYNKAGINFNITTDNIKLDLDKLDVGDSDMISNYTQGQKNIISAYKNKAKKDQYYIFFLDKDVELSKKNVEGFMPLKRQFGFVFTQKNPGRVAAHEIGHGIFGLKHPWDQYNTKKGKSNYLMDSDTSGTDFTHMDWQKLHAPGIQLYIFQGDEAGEFAGNYALAPNLKFVFINGTKTIYTGKDEKVFVTGTLPGFSFLDKSTNKISKSYLWNDYKKAYINVNDSYDSIVPQFRNELPTRNSVNLFYNLGEGCGQKSYVSLTYDEIRKSQKTITNDKRDVSDREKYLLNLVGKYTKTRSNPIVCGGSTTGGWREIGIYCNDVNISDLLSKDVEKIEKLKEETDTAKIVETVNKMNYKCVFETVDSEIILALILKLGSGLIILDNQEKAIVKLISFINNDKRDGLFKILKKDIGGKTLFENMISKFDDKKFYLFGENNESTLLRLLAYNLSKLEQDEEKWGYLNTLIKEKYADVNELSIKDFASKIVASMTNYNNVVNNLPAIIDLFSEMLISDVENLINYQSVLDIAILRISNREVFSTFTQGDKIEFEINEEGRPYAKCKAKVNSTFSNWSWIKPVNFGLTCNGVTMDVIYNVVISDPKRYMKITNVFVWAKYYSENKVKMDDLFSTNLVEYLRIFREQLNIHLKNVKSDNGNFWKDVIIDCNSLKDVFNQISINESSQSLNEVDNDKKLQILTSYFSCENKISLVSFQEIDAVLLKLLSSFDSSNVAVLQRIETIGLDKVFDKLKSKETSKTIAKIALWMGGQIVNSGHVKDLDLNVDTLIDDLGNFKKEQLLGLESDLDIFKFEEGVENFKATIKNKNQFKINEKLYDYNQKVAVYVAGDFEFCGQKFKQGSVLTVPMIQAYSMSESNRDIVNDKVFWLSVDVGTMALGVGEVMIFFKAGNVLRKTIVALDIASSAAGIAESLVNNNTLSKEARFNLQMFSLATSIPSMLTSIKKIDNLVSILDGVKGEVKMVTNTKVKSSLLNYIKILNKRLGFNFETRLAVLGYTPIEISKIIDAIKIQKLNDNALQKLVKNIKANTELKELLKVKPAQGLEAWSIFKKHGKKICN